jgi:hypothetical protein
MTADRQTVTVELAADEVLVALKRGEEYEDVHPELVSEDAIGDRWPEYRTIQPASQAPAEAHDIPEGDPWDEHQLDGIFDAIRNDCGPATASRVRAILRAFQAGFQPQPAGVAP